MELKAVDTKILLKPIKEEQLIEKVGTNKLLIPQGTGEYEEAEVISVGDQVTADIKASQRVLIYPGSGRKFTVDGEEYMVITANEIIVVKG